MIEIISKNKIRDKTNLNNLRKQFKFTIYSS